MNRQTVDGWAGKTEGWTDRKINKKMGRNANW